ncbi:hypothetical protein BS50DRAFT_187763 [Corynespora cassiicola Philippines]|uniref:Rhodopsin domain-containing protein n=1 Tax=Corynespora cassiicola Philippines TaxID=1448308 RepID=A0A2T2P714_CORCC|nr:hypothetical protein BS50DRAFT_187763 [Corynespora cassiicola Philippines]
MSSSPSAGDAHVFISMRTYQVTMWTLSGLATLFLASRFAVRMLAKGHLIMNDYFIAAALPTFYLAAGLIQSNLGVLYEHNPPVLPVDQEHPVSPQSAAPRLTSAIELFWTTIYCVKFCFLAQFKFHKPPYAYVSIRLTRYYFALIGICVAAFLFTLIQPIVLCSHPVRCRYFEPSNTMPWEAAVTGLDIATDFLVVTVPVSLICMANFTRLRATLNAIFKGLSIFVIAVAGVRLKMQYNAETRRVDYVSLTFWLMVEAAVALIMASISSYRIPVVDYIIGWKSDHCDKPKPPEEIQLCTPRDVTADTFHHKKKYTQDG